jgi:ATP-binding cassette subfamily F protein uup
VLQEKFDKKLAEEEIWVRQGIKARRTRNEGRVRALMAMREERAARREQLGAVRMQVELADPSGRLVFEAREVTKSFGGAPVIAGLSTRVMRGDRIGLIGPNGTGKTTMLRLLLGEIAPDAGEIRRGVNVQVAYYDQQREQLDPEKTVFDTIGEGNDSVTVSGRSRHVNGYLADFLFPPERARSPVKGLSGGERNRLLLARLFTRPANVLVLDERSRSRVARAPRGTAGRVSRHASARQPRSRVSGQCRHEHTRLRRRRESPGVCRRVPGLAQATARGGGARGATDAPKRRD